MKDFSVRVWHYTMSMKTFKPIVRLHELKVGLSENDIVPKDFESRYLEATMKNISLKDAFEYEFKYGLSNAVLERIKSQIGNYLRNASLVVLDLYPGVVIVVDSTCPTIRRGIFCDYEVKTFSEHLT